MGKGKGLNEKGYPSIWIALRKKESGSVLLFHTLVCSTIGDRELDF